MIIHAYSGLRPSSTTQSAKTSNTKKSEEMKMEPDEMAKLRYGDFTLVLTTDDKNKPRFGVRPLFCHFKNEIRRAQRWVDPANLRSSLRG